VNSEKIKGVVRWFSARKGYGFIAPEGSDKDVFVHYSGIVMEGYRTLQAEDKVLFNYKDHDKGAIAIDVEILKPSQPKDETN